MFKITNVTFPLVSHEFDKIKVCVFKKIYKINHLFICKSYVLLDISPNKSLTWHLTQLLEKKIFDKKSLSL